MTSRNAGSVRTRTVGTALYNMGVQSSNIIAANVSNLFPIASVPIVESNISMNRL